MQVNLPSIGSGCFVKKDAYRLVRKTITKEHSFMMIVLFLQVYFIGLLIFIISFKYQYILSNILPLNTSVLDKFNLVDVWKCLNPGLVQFTYIDP